MVAAELEVGDILHAQTGQEESVDIVDENGTIIIGRWYDSTGKAYGDVDMKGIILEQGNHTFLKKIFANMNGEQLKYNWLITNYECYPQGQENIKLFASKFCWISGFRLTQAVMEEDFQWIWGVFSGFKKDILKEDILKYDFPIADGNKQLWENPVTIQHPLADLEIVAWDGRLTLILSKEDRFMEDLSNNFPCAKDLFTYSRRM